MNFKKRALNYSGKKLTEFPAEVFSGRRVYKLNLSHNNISRIPKEVAGLKHLETLDLSDNKIRHLYAKLFDLSNLKILILNNNEIVNLPRQIEQLQHLKILQLANNKLSSLPIEVSHLTSLEELNVNGNSLNDLPLNNGGYLKLRSLWMANNPLKNLTAQNLLKGMPTLKSVYCFNPKLENRVLSEDWAIYSASTSKGNSMSIISIDYTQIKLSESPWKKVLQARQDRSSGVNVSAITSLDPVNTIKPKIFISYAHKDEEYLNRLKVHLKVLGRSITLDVWDDTRIRSSDKWQEAIEAELNQASDAILLISTDFLASDFINDNELPPLLEAAKQRGTRIHPVIVHPCQFLKFKPLSQFQAANSPDEALSECPSHKQERIWMKLCNDIQHFLGQ